MKKFRIETNIIAYGPEPAPSDEVEQHLTVPETGRIWFNAELKKRLKELVQKDIDLGVKIIMNGGK